MTAPIGLLHPGEMGGAVGAALANAGNRVLWCPDGRSAATAARARAAGLEEAPTLPELVASAGVVVSICPPHAAFDVALAVAGAAAGKAGWFYVDANAVAPSTAARISDAVGGAGARYVDGGIIGPPPLRAGTTRLYLSGPGSLEASSALATTEVEIHVVGEGAFSASALKLCYSAWTKGSAALLLTARAAAGRAGVEEVLLSEWRASLPELASRHERAQRSARSKGWRWAGEMEEVASMMEALGLPGGFHEAAAAVYSSGVGLGGLA